MTIRTKFISTLGGMMLLAGFAAACNDSNFKSDPKTRPLVKKKDADAVVQSPSSPAVQEPVVIEPETVVSKLPDSLVQVYPGAVEKEGKFPFSLDLKTAETSFTLENTTQSVEDKRTQITRAKATNMFSQGTGGSSITNKFPAQKGLVDIAVIIDNSGSMSEEQGELSGKLNDLLVSIKDVDWRIGVITTSVPAAGGQYQFNNCQLTLIKKSDGGNLSQKFQDAINAAGLKGDGNEQGIAQSINALSCTTPAWVRSNSTVAVLIVSDEDNCSQGGDAGCLGNETKLIDFVEGPMGRVVGKNAGFFGLFHIPGQAIVGQGSSGTQYLRLMKYKNNTGLNFGSIGDSSYSTTLNNISDSIAKLLPSQIGLSDVPDAGSVVLKIGNSVINANDYTINGQTITFKAGKEPSDGLEIVATYTVGAIPFFANDSITLSATPAAETVEVRLTEKNKAVRVMAANEYTITNNVIKFNAKPSDLAKVDVDFRVKQDLLTRFAPAQKPKVETLKVKVNGANSTAFTYDAAKNEVVLNSAPADGQEVILSYTFNSGNKLAYELPLMSGGKDFKVLDGATELNFAQNGNFFTILNKDFVAGKVLVLKYDIPDGADRSFDLPHDPIDGSETLDSAGVCKLGNGITLAASKLVANCAVEEKTDFVLTYKYLEAQKVYSIDGVPDPEKGTWIVNVDGQPTLSYVRVGSEITLSFEPGVDSKIDIRYTFPE